MSGRLVLAGTLATLLAVAANVILSIVLRAAVDPSGIFQPLNVGSVALLTAFGAIAATFVYEYIVARSEDPRGRFIRVAVIALLLSFVPDLALLAGVGPGQNADVPRVLALMSMHVVAAVIIVSVLITLGPQRSNALPAKTASAKTDDGSTDGGASDSSV
ncbi:MAG TPA: DUF6069 family protein [Candidatus Limnocylindrales bacterium]|nr:DUF6069 family protein [Candidatus Limnocylindrales bacterium]